MKLKERYAALVGISILLISVGLLVGPMDLSLSETFAGLIRSDDGEVMKIIIWNIRAPRVAVSIVAGACLGLAGILIQLSSRSPLGDPNLFGIGGGAAIFLAASMAGIVSVDHFGRFLGCVGSSLIVSAFLLRLISNRDLTPVKLAIMGIAVGALTVSVGTSVISHARIFPTQLIGLVAGSFTGSSWTVFWYLLPTFCLSLATSIALSKRFYPVMLGDTLAKSLGVNPIRTRILAMSLVGVLAGAAVYAGGLIGFVGLFSPHVARKIFGNAPFHLVIGASVIGAMSTICSDQISRLLFAPTELPVGLTTTIVGALSMMYLGLKMK